MSQSPTHRNDTPAPASSRPSGEKQGERPPRHRTFSLLGSASEIQRDPLAFLLRTQQVGEVVRSRFLFSPTYLVSDPDATPSLRSADDDAPNRKGRKAAFLKRYVITTQELSTKHLHMGSAYPILLSVRSATWEVLPMDSRGFTLGCDEEAITAIQGIAQKSTATLKIYNSISKHESRRERDDKFSGSHRWSRSGWTGRRDHACPIRYRCPGGGKAG